MDLAKPAIESALCHLCAGERRPSRPSRVRTEHPPRHGGQTPHHQPFRGSVVLPPYGDRVIEAQPTTHPATLRRAVTDDESRAVVDAIAAVRTRPGDRPVDDITIESIEIED